MASFQFASSRYSCVAPTTSRSGSYGATTASKPPTWSSNGPAFPGRVHEDPPPPLRHRQPEELVLGDVEALGRVEARRRAQRRRRGRRPTRGTGRRSSTACRTHRTAAARDPGGGTRSRTRAAHRDSARTRSTPSFPMRTAWRARLRDLRRPADAHPRPGEEVLAAPRRRTAGSMYAPRGSIWPDPRVEDGLELVTRQRRSVDGRHLRSSGSGSLHACGRRRCAASPGTRGCR